MAVQKSKCTRSKRGKRRLHDFIKKKYFFSIDKVTGEKHLRHHITKNNFYKGNKYYF